MAITTLDQQMLARSYSIARLGHGHVSPNPCVGAILVHDGHIIGEGFHHKVGGPHAEIECLNSVRPHDHEKVRSSTMYVSLEPCSHHGRTPPCAHELVKRGVARVVIGLSDPNPKVAGNGIAYLRNHGVKVELAAHTDDAIYTAKEFIVNQVQRRPHVTLKWAQSKDGYLGRENQSTKISNNLSDVLVHRWRSEADAILVGTTTAILDNPRLTTRLLEGKNARRIVIDRNAEIPTGHHLFTDGNSTIVYGQRREEIEAPQIHFIDIKGSNHQEEISHLLIEVFKQNINSLIVEGGAKLLGSFITSGLWDEARIITSAHNLIEGIKAPSLLGKLIAKHSVASDIIQHIQNKEQMQTLKGTLSTQLS